MTVRKTLQIISFGLLLYLLADSFIHFDIAASKNTALTIMQKMEVDSTQNIDVVKLKSKTYLDTIRRVQKNIKQSQ